MFLQWLQHSPRCCSSPAICLEGTFSWSTVAFDQHLGPCWARLWFPAEMIDLHWKGSLERGFHHGNIPEWPPGASPAWGTLELQWNKKLGFTHSSVCTQLGTLLRCISFFLELLWNCSDGERSCLCLEHVQNLWRDVAVTQVLSAVKHSWLKTQLN